MNADSKKVRLQTSDGKVVEVDTEVIKLSNLVKRKMEDVTKSDPIQLPNVNAAILNKVIQWCEFHKNDPPPLEEDENKEKRTDDEVKQWDAEFLKANQEVLYDLSLAAHYMDLERLLDLTTPIRQLPSELLVKVIEKLPRTQWPALELIDHKFRDATLLAWGSIREVDIERDFIYSESKAIDDDKSDAAVLRGRLRYQIAEKTEAILKKLSERSPFITSLIGVSLNTDEPTWNSTAIQYLANFEHLETIKFAKKDFLDRIVKCDIPFINFIEFMESTQSRATLKEIRIEQCRIPIDPIIVANFDRLCAAFANDSNDPTRQLLQLESLSLRLTGRNYPLTFLDSVDPSKLTKFSLGHLRVEPAVLTNLINRAPGLQHIDFAFLNLCNFHANRPVCQGGRLQPNKDLLAALGSRPSLTSLGFSSIWNIFGTCACQRFEAEFKQMLRTIGPQLINFIFKPGYLRTGIRMGEVRDIIQKHMPNLKSIALNHCCTDNPEELRGIADGKELEEIEIDTFPPDGNFNNYEANLNGVISTIISKSPRLKRFNGIDYHPDQRVATDLSKLSDLTDLRIRADRLTTENFVVISQQAFAEKLEVLHLSSIEAGVEPGLIEFVAKAPQLRELVVDGYVTDRLLECLAESCSNLEKFNASLTVGITLGGVQMLVDRCAKLRWLGVENTTRTLASTLKNLKLGPYRKLELE